MRTKILTTLGVFFVLASAALSQAQEAVKIDEFENPQCEDYLGRMDYVGDYSKNNPSSKVYILIYEGKENIFNNRSGVFELAYPNFGSAQIKIRSMKKYLSTRGFSTEKIVFIKAGFRENLAIEVWSVPIGKTPPKPTPTLKKMKYRKGKPEGFCLGCCEV